MSSQDDSDLTDTALNSSETIYTESYEIADETDNAADWSSLTVAALKSALQDKGLQTSGRKAELVARLEASQGQSNVTETDCETVALAAEIHGDDDDDNDVAQQQSASCISAVAETVDDVEDEFVEWDETEDDLKTVEEPSAVSDSEILKVEVVDEVKIADVEERTDDEEKNDDSTKDDSRQLTVDDETKKERESSPELSVNVDKDKDSVYIVWQSKKITIPFKEDITKDLETYDRLQTVIIYPLLTADVYSDSVRNHVELASVVELTLEDTVPGKPSKGYLKLRFSDAAKAKQAMEELSNLCEGVTAKYLAKNESASKIMSKLRKDDCERRGPTLYRLLFIGNLPTDVNVTMLRQHFPEALEVILPCDENTTERLGYAYLEFVDEKTTYEMCEKYHNTEMNGVKLYVIQAITEKRDNYGLLRDSLRLYWSEQVYKQQKIIDKPYSHPKWEVSDAEEKLQVLKRRLEKDSRRREVLHLPCPDYVDTKHEDESTDDQHDKPSNVDKTENRKSREQSSNRRDRRSSPPRRSTPRRYEYSRGPRSGGQGVSNYAQRREDVADKLVNQLQGLVSALSNTLPTVERPRSLLDDLQLSSYPRSVTGSGGVRGGTAGYSSSSLAADLSRYAATAAALTAGKRYHDDADQLGNDRKRRPGNYGGSSSGHYEGSGMSRQYNRPKF